MDNCGRDDIFFWFSPKFGQKMVTLSIYRDPRLFSFRSTSLNWIHRLKSFAISALGYLITLIGRTKKSSRPQMSCFH